MANIASSSASLTESVLDTVDFLGDDNIDLYDLPPTLLQLVPLTLA